MSEIIWSFDKSQSIKAFWVSDIDNHGFDWYGREDEDGNAKYGYNYFLNNPSILYSYQMKLIWVFLYLLKYIKK